MKMWIGLIGHWLRRAVWEMRLEGVRPSYRINHLMKEVLRRSVCEKGEVLWRRGDREREAG